jgi:hypothetical protein
MERNLFGPRRSEKAKDWKKLHKKELHNLYPLPKFKGAVISIKMNGIIIHMKQ